MKKVVLYILLMLVSIVAIAAVQAPPVSSADKDKKQADVSTKPQPKSQPKLAVEEETIPDSLLHPRWKIKRTAPIFVNDLDSSALDLKMPDNIKQQVVYNDSLNLYFIGSKIGDSYLNAPLLMTPEEYAKWSERRSMRDFFRKKDAENVANKGKEKF